MGIQAGEAHGEYTPGEAATTITSEVLSTVEPEAPTITISGGYVSIPPESLPKGATVTVTMTYTLVISEPY